MRRPVGVDLGVLAVLDDVIVERVAARGERRDDEVEVVRIAIGEDDRRLIVAAEQREDVGGQLGLEVGAPERAMVGRVLDDGPRVAHQRGVQAQLLGDRPGRR